MKKKLILFTIFISLLIIFGYCFCHNLGVNTIQAQKANFVNFVESNYFISILLYVLSYVLIVVSSLPLTAFLTILSGFLFGTWQGSIYSLVAAAIGATLSLLMFRYLLGNDVQKNYSGKLTKFKESIEKYGSRYLIMVHLFMIVPFFIINVLASMVRVSYFTFIWTTIVGMIPSTILYSYAGNQLRIANSVGEIFSWKVILAFGLMILLGFGSIIYENLKAKKFMNQN